MDLDQFSILSDLSALIKQRQHDAPERSYTAKLLHEGVDRIAKKIGEEAGEVIIAAKNQDSTELCNEAADLLYHLMILLENQHLDLRDVCKVLSDRRHKA